MKIIMSNENTKYNNDDFLKKYNEVFKDSFSASQSETKTEPVLKKKAAVKPIVHKEKKKHVKKRKRKAKNIFSAFFKKILSLFKRRKNEQGPAKAIDIDIYSTDDIDLPLDLPKNLMNPESTEIQLTMFEGVEDSETYQERLNSDIDEADENTDYGDDENENQIRIEDLIKESIIRDRKADPYADKLQYDENVPAYEDADDTDPMGDTMIFEPVKQAGFPYKSVDEILRDVNLPSDDDDSDDGQAPRRRRAGASD